MRPVTQSHGGKASVGVPGAKPTQHAVSGDNADCNAKTNAALRQAGGSTPRKQPTAGQMVAAGLTGTTEG